MNTDTPRNACPHCGAKHWEEGAGFHCGSEYIIQADGENPIMYRVSTCYTRELTASKAEVERLKEAMISCLHITNCYDGNYAAACDNVDLIVRNALISLTPDKTNQ
jgi:hypothetical protein